MGGSKKDVGRFKEDSVVVAKKIATYSQIDPTGEKLLKYMRHVSVLRKGVSTTRSRSIWTELKNHGALSSIMTTLQKVFDSEDVRRMTVANIDAKGRNDNEAGMNRAVEVCNVGLSILSNAFALDYAVRSEAMKNGFISSLQQFLANFTQDEYITFKNTELISRAVKCAANLSNDSQSRESVLRNGVAISVLRILEHADEKMTSSLCCDSKAFVDDDDVAQLLSSCVRAVRIMASDSKYLSNGREHLLKFGGLITVINTLTWDANLSSNEDFVLDVIRALTFLSVRIRSAPFNIIQTLIYNPENSKVRRVVRLFENSQPESKLYSPLINCLINFSSNKEVSDCLGALRIFHIILTKLTDLDDEQHYHDLIKLLIALTRYSSFNQSHLATSPLVGSTLKILKLPRFKDYHEWLLTVYENLYDVSLSKLVQSGLVNYLCDLFREEIEDCNYDGLRKKISSLDDSKCSVHSAEDVCPFAPAYRCLSPSYQQIQEEMKTRIGTSEIPCTSSSKKGEDSLSPFSSPAHSCSSGANSPVHSEASSMSYSAFSEDEGCFSPGSNAMLLDAHSPAAVSDEEDGILLEETLTENENTDEIQGPPVKRPKLNESSPSASSSSESSRSNDCKFDGYKSLESLKSSVKKIVGILNIFYKCTHIKPFPESILQIIPTLLGIILRGKVSLMSQGLEYQSFPKDDEIHEFSRRTFEVAYKILLKMCSTMQTFPELIQHGMLPVLHRLQEPFTAICKNEDGVAVVQKYCENLIKSMTGFENDTAGWREGFIMRSVLVNNSGISGEKMDQMLINIPLLYQKHASTLRKFERKARSFTKILDMLKNSDDASFYRFEDCALALCSIALALGIKWTAPVSEEKVSLLSRYCSNTKNDNSVLIYSAKDQISENHDSDLSSEETIERVKLILDDGTVFLVKKDLLVSASPVFSAMFDGHFIEADQQKVHLPKVSKDSVSLLIDQIRILNEPNNENDKGDNCRCNFDLAVIFELFTLADRFLLEEVYERALNTVIMEYLCPYSAPLVYTESVKLANLQKSSCNRQLGDSALNLLILKYILTADNIRMSERCNAIRKVFDSVVPEHVVQDLGALIDEHMYKNM